MWWDGRLEIEWLAKYYKEWSDGHIVPGLGIGLGSNESDGILAEYVILKTNQILHAPQSLSYIEASTLSCVGLTAWSALNGNRPYLNPLKKANKVLVLGTGNVAIMAISLAKKIGAEVYCTTSQDFKINILKNIGVKEVINYKKNSNWGEIAFKMTNEIDVVVNTAGAASIGESFKALDYGGRMALVGAMDATDKLPDLLPMIFKNIIVYDILAGSSAAFKDLNAFIDNHKVKPYIDKIFSFEEVKRAYEEAKSWKTVGKVIIKIHAE